jgi:phosphatidylserine decarboxylase
MTKLGRPSGGRLRSRLASVRQSVALQQQDAPSPLASAALSASPPFLHDLPGPDQTYAPKQPITQQLKQLIDDNGYAEAFQRAITAVSAQHVPELARIQTLFQFYCYVDALVTWTPELRLWEWEGTVYHERTDYLRITQFYYYFNQPTLEALQSPVDPVSGAELTPVSRWLRDCAVSWGAYLDTPESATRLESYKFGPEYAWQDYAGWPYPTFNHWFSRTFRDIDCQRPVAQPDDPRVIAYPAESTFVGQWAIGTPVPAGEPMPAPASITVKHVEWPIPELLSDSRYAADFEGGILAHSFLNVYDYHRQHAPASGRILEAKFIPGQVYLEVDLKLLDQEQRETESSALANALIPPRYLDAADNTGYQFVQCRGLMVLETAVGKIAVLPMGMAQVSSVVFVEPGTEALIQLSEADKQHLDYDQQVQKINDMLAAKLVGRTIKKGDMISTFLFGGSDIVMVFERRSNVNITSSIGVHYPVRSQYAYANIAELLAY